MTIATHDPRTRRATRWWSAGALVVVVAAPAAAGLVPGGGPAASDCYAELDVAGIENGTASVKRNKIVRCVDGDPCDAGPCGDGVCDFQLRLCWNQRDPNVPACEPPSALGSLDLRGPLAALMLMPRDLDGSTCTDGYTSFGVPTKGNGTRPGHLNVRIVAKAPDGMTPAVDNDLIRLVCVPRPFEQCGGAVSTTTLASTTTVPTTTIHASTTTTRTSSTTSTTHRRPRKTTSTTTTRPATSSSTRPPTTSLPPPTTSTTVTPTTSPPQTTGVPTTTTPTLETTTTTQRKTHGDGGDALGIPVPVF